LKGHGFSRADTEQEISVLYRLRKSSIEVGIDLVLQIGIVFVLKGRGFQPRRLRAKK
jgi:hypothetical protein